MNSVDPVSKLFRRLRRFMLPEAVRAPYSTARHIGMFERAWNGVWGFYLVTLFFAYQSMYLLMQQYSKPGAHSFAIDPYWPVFFATSENLSLVTGCITLFFLLSSILVLLRPSSRLLRALLFISLLQTAALKYSFGVTNEKEQWWMWVALVFVFLPAMERSKIQASLRLRQYYLSVFAIAQAIVLLIYSIIGFWKFFFGINALLTVNMKGIFHYEALGYIMANRVITSHSPSLVGAYVLEYPLLAMIGFIFISYIQLTAIVAWFRPALQPLWAALFILLHVGIWLTMNIVFYLQPPLLALLFFSSPFLVRTTPLRQLLAQLPGIHGLLRLRHWLLAKDR